MVINNTIVKYDGSAFTEIYYDPEITESSIAVDDSGNVWFFDGDPSTLIANQIKVISPLGQVIKTYNINSLDMEYSSGSFIIGNILYIGFGSGSILYPNSLLPFSFTDDSAILGNSTIMPSESFNKIFIDMASCNPGSPLPPQPLSLASLTNKCGFTLSPNPVSNDMVSISTDQNLVDKTVVVTDIEGRQVWQMLLNH